MRVERMFVMDGIVVVFEGPYRVDETRERMGFILSLTLEERGEVV